MSSLIKYNSISLPAVWKNKLSTDIQFSRKLKRIWDDLHQFKTVFRYGINHIETKFLGEKYMLQLNPDRGSKRRHPEHIESICQPFDSQLFNFNKVSEEEVIMHVMNDKESEIHSILINVSPISRYHSLICPSVTKCQPQVATVDSLQLVLEIMFLCQDRDIRIGFNSLCALASVNHLHYHILVEPNILPVEKVICKHIVGNIYCFEDTYAVPALCFEISRSADIVTISKDVHKLVQYFIVENIAHNILITRGDGLTDVSSEVIRLLVWPRKSCLGVKQLEAFNIAVCELAGWFPIYNRKDFDSLQVEDLEKELRKWKLDNFEELCDKIKTLYKNS